MNMASIPKQKKLSKSEKRQLMAEKSKKAVEKRGTGVGSQQQFFLPARWESEGT